MKSQIKFHFLWLALTPILFSCNSNYLSDSLSESGLFEHSLSLSYQGQNTVNSSPFSTPIELDTLSNGIVVRRIDSLYLFQDDMLFTDSTLFILEGFSNQRGAVQVCHYWPNGIIYYAFDDNVDSGSSFVSYAQEAMALISSYTGLTFQPRTILNPNYINFVRSDSRNNSFVGMVGGKQNIMIYDADISTFTHEILHSIGLLHEQSRSDRDNYILINWANIKPDYVSNYNKYSSDGPSGIDIGNFDFNSIMMYGSYSNNSEAVYDITQPVLTKLDGSTFYGGSSMTSRDIASVKSIYGPPYHRLERTYYVSMDISENTYERYEATVSNCIYFYYNKLCTLPFSTDYPRIIYLKEEVTQTNGYGNLYTQTNVRPVYIPAGTDSLNLGQTIHSEYYTFSNPSSVYIKKYSIENSLVPDLNVFIQ